MSEYHGTAASEAIPIEVEAALVICDANPQDVVERLAAMQHLGGYRLYPCPEKRIHDIYLDTPGNALAARMLSLRLREVNGIFKLTLKGEAGQEASDLKTRRELERDWADGALESIAAELASYGVHLPVSESVPETKPLAALLARGLNIIQERSTHRIVREVTRDPSPGASPVAELAIDAVLYHLARDIRHHEVEIELAAGEPPATARQLSASLQAAFPGRLRPWTRAKLTLGMWLRDLLQQGRMEGIIAEDGTLPPDAYEIITSSLNYRL